MAVRRQLKKEGGGDAGDASANEGCLPAFRFERKGFAFDEYRAHADAPYEEELAKRVEAALSLSKPGDAGEEKAGVLYSSPAFGMLPRKTDPAGRCSHLRCCCALLRPVTFLLRYCSTNWTSCRHLWTPVLLVRLRANYEQS